MKTIYRLLLPCLLIMATGCSGNQESGTGELLSLLPYPQQVKLQKGTFHPGDGPVCFKASGTDANTDPVIFAQLDTASRDVYGKPLETCDGGSPVIWIGITGTDPDFAAVCKAEQIQPPEKIGEEAYVLKITSERVLIAASTNVGLFYGVQTLRQLWRAYPEKPGIPCMEITDWPAIPMRVVMDDISRGPIPRNEYIKEQIRRYSELKINHMSFYIEHVVKTQKHPGFAPDGAITIKEFREISDYAADYHITVIGGFQSLGHFAEILKVPAFRHLGATDRMLDPLNPEAIAFLLDVYGEMAPAFTSTLFIAHCDEAWDLSRVELTGEAAKLGVARIYADHIKRIDTILLELGKRTLIWGDIIMDYPEILDQLPDHILTGAWNYDARDSFAEFIDPLKDAGFDFTISPGVLNSNRLFPDYHMTFTNIRNFIKLHLQ